MCAVGLLCPIAGGVGLVAFLFFSAWIFVLFFGLNFEAWCAVVWVFIFHPCTCFPLLSAVAMYGYCRRLCDANECKIIFGQWLMGGLMLCG